MTPEEEAREFTMNVRERLWVKILFDCARIGYERVLEILDEAEAKGTELGKLGFVRSVEKAFIVDPVEDPYSRKKRNEG